VHKKPPLVIIGDALKVVFYVFPGADEYQNSFYQARGLK